MKIDIPKLFLENIGIKQTIIKNTFWLTLAEIITGILRFALLIYVARALGVAEYGKFTFAFSFVSVMVIFSDLGVIDIITREFSRDANKQKRFSDILTLDIILSAVVLVLMVVGSFLITSDTAIQKIIWLLSVFILTTNFFGIFYAFQRSEQKMEYEAGIKIVQAVILVAASFLAVLYVPSALSLGYGYLFSNLIALFFLLLLFHFYFLPLRLNFSKNIFNILKLSWPLTFGFMGQWIYISISSVMLGYFNFIAENGWYNAASKIAIFAILPASLIIRSFYPALSNFFISSKEKLQKSWDFLMQLMIILSVPMLFGSIKLAPKIIDFLYGSDFVPSVLVFQILMIVVAITFVNFPYSTMLVISNQQKKNFILIIIGIVINIALNLVLIPSYKLLGAAIAVLASTIITFSLTVMFSKRFVLDTVFDVKLLKTVAVAIFSSFIMLFVISFPAIYNLNIVFAIFIGIVAYFSVLLPFYKPLLKPV